MRRFLEHLPEYAIEAVLLGAFMASACGFGVLLEHPDSPVHRAIVDPVVRRVLMGLAMGLTAIAIIYSPWGGWSGAHINPAATLTFGRLGRIRGVDVVGYVGAQFMGAVAGVAVASSVLGPRLAHASVNYVATLPRPWGVVPPCWESAHRLPLGPVHRPGPRRTGGDVHQRGSTDLRDEHEPCPDLRIGVGRSRARPACPKLEHPDSQRCIFCGHEPVAEIGAARLERG